MPNTKDNNQGNKGGFAQDRNKAAEAGRKGGQASTGKTQNENQSK